VQEFRQRYALRFHSRNAGRVLTHDHFVEHRVLRAVVGIAAPSFTADPGRLCCVWALDLRRMALDALGLRGGSVRAALRIYRIGIDSFG